ncbi:cell division protein FtsQ/DivIB [Orenia marismortui]|uniref:Cell division protein FtsQ n=1 Tax=Orenia marismortui TaxID=46469 RepID=A0A4R8H307_9FIRM|nr:cell division protein FtsQ/DivIB [Orenia marismortui]TDX53010.1 cell division protein FtsQ [Orenia marismortui]
MDKHRTIYLISIGVLSVIAILSLINSNYFQVTEIEIVGNKLLSDEYIVNFSKVKDINIFKIDRQEIAKRLLGLQQVKGVAVKRDLPNKLILEINERRPVAIVGLKSSYQIIDNQGWVIATSKNLAEWDLPLITGVKIANHDDKVKFTTELKLAIDYLDLLSDQILKEVSELNISKDKGIELYLLGGGVVKLGKKFDTKTKAQIFISVYNDLKSQAKKVKYIDLRYKNNTVVKLEK